MHTHRRTAVAYTVQWSEGKLVALCAVELVCSEALCTQGLGLFLVTLLSYSVPKCSATARLVLSGLIPLKHWAVYVSSRLLNVFFPPFLFSFMFLLILTCSCSDADLWDTWKIVWKKKRWGGLGGERGKGRGKWCFSWPADLSLCSVWRPVGDAHIEGKGHTCWGHCVIWHHKLPLWLIRLRVMVQIVAGIFPAVLWTHTVRHEIACRRLLDAMTADKEKRR